MISILFFRFSEGSLNLDETYILKILNWAIERISTLSDLVTKDMEFIWILPTAKNLEARDFQTLNLFKHILENKGENEITEINAICKEFCKENSVKFGPFMKLLRRVLTGLTVRKNCNG